MGTRVLLVDTSAPGSNGSMARYAGLVMEALGGAVGQGIEFERLVLSAPGVLNGFSGTRARKLTSSFVRGPSRAPSTGGIKSRASGNRHACA